ncbi:F-box only protein 7-like isoform X2 [Gigantopelta aegis]|nr:F-box only protein 7-like isoform X2 [Gigantopelta aegis]
MVSVQGSTSMASSRAQAAEPVGNTSRNTTDDAMIEGTSRNSAVTAACMIEGTSRDTAGGVMAEDTSRDTTDDMMAEGTSEETANYFMGERPVEDDSGVAVFDAVVNKCLSEPLLCSESTRNAVPAALDHLFANSGCRSKGDALWIVIHAMMLESGYQLVQDVRCDPLDYLALPKDWQTRGFYRFPYTHSHTEHLVCSVTGVPMGSSLVIHGLVEGSSKFHTQQLQVKTSEFVTDDLTGALQCYKNLDKLSRYVKDRICLPLVNAVRAELGLPDSEGLLALTHELQLKIFTYLDAWSALKVDQTCKQCHFVVRDPYIWRRLFLQDFGRADNLSLSSPWYNLYKAEYRKKMEKKKALAQMMFVTPNLLWGPHRHPPPEFPPLYPHGIIGGDYDLHPEFYGIPNPFLIHPGQAGPAIPRPRFDPFGPSPDHQDFPGTGRAGRLRGTGFGSIGGFGHHAGPRFF